MLTFPFTAFAKRLTRTFRATSLTQSARYYICIRINNILTSHKSASIIIAVECSPSRATRSLGQGNGGKNYTMDFAKQLKHAV